MLIDPFFVAITKNFLLHLNWVKLPLAFAADYSGYLIIFIVCILLVRNFQKYKIMLWQMIAAVVLSRGIITEIIRFIWHRDRPFVVEHFLPIINHPELSGSFPSGHAAFYFAIATVVYFYNKKIGVVLLLLSFVMGLGRVFAGVHWFSDILAGAAIGILCAWFIKKMCRGRELNPHLLAKTGF